MIFVYNRGKQNNTTGGGGRGGGTCIDAILEKKGQDRQKTGFVVLSS